MHLNCIGFNGIRLDSRFSGIIINERKTNLENDVTLLKRRMIIRKSKIKILA